MEIFVIEEYLNISPTCTFPDTKIVSFSGSVFPARHELLWSQSPCIGMPDAILHLQTTQKLNIMTELGVCKGVKVLSVFYHLDFIMGHIAESLEQISDAEYAAK